MNFIDPTYFYLVVWPLIIVVLALVFSFYMRRSIERDYRNRIRALIVEYESECVAMDERINEARTAGITTETGAATATRLIANARQAIAAASRLTNDNPRARELWTRAGQELSTAHRLVRNVPVALAEAWIE